MQNNPITVFGEVLFDHFPDGTKVLGGAPFNVAWHLQAFGQNSQFISRVGNDIEGKEIADLMELWGINQHFLQKDSSYPTGSVEIALDGGEPSYAILPEQAYDFITLDGLDAIDYVGILYHGTLASRSPTSKQTLSMLKTLQQASIFIDVNLRQPWWNKDEVLKLINDANWVKLNLHEFLALQGDITHIKDSMNEFMSQYKLEGIIVTCGKKGALGLDNSGECFSIEPTESVDVVDTVGAGDAYSAVILLGLNLGWDLGETMCRAQTFASAIIGKRGATVQDLDFYKPFITSWNL
jgi:fructokinase